MPNNERTKITTIKIQNQTKERLDKLRVHKKDSYDEIVQRLLGILNVCRRDPDVAQENLIKLENLAKKNGVFLDVPETKKSSAGVSKQPIQQRK